MLTFIYLYILSYDGFLCFSKLHRILYVHVLFLLVYNRYIKILCRLFRLFRHILDVACNMIECQQKNITLTIYYFVQA